jgi:hypothetical protein
MAEGFVTLRSSSDALDRLEDGLAFFLQTLVARRTRQLHGSVPKSPDTLSGHWLQRHLQVRTLDQSGLAPAGEHEATIRLGDTLDADSGRIPAGEPIKRSVCNCLGNQDLRRRGRDGDTRKGKISVKIQQND